MHYLIGIAHARAHIHTVAYVLLVMCRNIDKEKCEIGQNRLAGIRGVRYLLSIYAD